MKDKKQPEVLILSTREEVIEEIYKRLDIKKTNGASGYLGKEEAEAILSAVISLQRAKD